MTIQFNHKGETVTAKVLWFPAHITHVIVLFPDTHADELGWTILLTKVDEIWETDFSLTEKYLTTSLNILSQISMIETNLKKESMN